MKFALAALAATLTAGSAMAGGYAAPVVDAAPVAAAPVVVEQGSDWTGFYAGLQYGQGSGELSSDSVNDESDFDAYGVHGGYMYDLGKYVVGGELDYNKVDIDEVDEKGDMTRLRARAGYDMGRFLPYATLGVAHLSADLGTADVSDNGFTYGIGVDYLVTERFTVGAEYSHTKFSDVADVDGLDLDDDLVQVRGSFRF